MDAVSYLFRPNRSRRQRGKPAWHPELLDAELAVARPCRGASWLLPAFLLLLAMATLYLLRPRQFDRTLDSDESEYITVSIHHFQQLIRGQPPAGHDPATQGTDYHPWRVGVHDTNWGYDIPGLPKLIWGAVLDLAGYRDATLDVLTEYEPDRARRIEATQTLLAPMPWARWTTLFFAAWCAALVFSAGRALRGTATGLVAYGLFVFSPLVYQSAMYIRIDYFQLAFSLLTLWAGLRLRPVLAGRRGALALAGAGALLGLLSGLAVSCKLSGAYNGVAVAFWILCLWVLARAETRMPFWKGPLPALGLAGLCAWLAFYGLNPVLWGDAAGGVRAILAKWDELMTWIHGLYDWEPGKADTPGEKVLLAARQVLTLYEPVAHWLGLRTAEAPGLPEGMPITTGLAHWLGLRGSHEFVWKLAGLVVSLVLLGAGLVVLARRAFRSGDGDTARKAQIVLAYVVFSGVVVTYWLPLAIPRYFLPYHPSVVLLDALCLTTLVAWLRRRAAAPRARAPSGMPPS